MQIFTLLNKRVLDLSSPFFNLYGLCVNFSGFGLSPIKINSKVRDELYSQFEAFSINRRENYRHVSLSGIYGKNG